MLLTQALGSNDVFILGAGFSKAIHQSMPVLRDLGIEVADQLRDTLPEPHDNLRPEDFERWLTFLSEDQPWQSEYENTRNRALFLLASETLRDVLRRHVREARGGPCPEWLRCLVARWHRSRATVITFNYDPLVEAAFVETVTVRTQPDSPDNYVEASMLYPLPVTPVNARYGGAFAASPMPTFELLKLHGSMTWAYSGRTEFGGETLFDLGVGQTWSGDATPSAAASDKVPLIVPPTFGKSQFFRHETVREQWRRAFEAVRRADRLVCMGYSLPPGDTLTRFLLGSAVAPEAVIVPVDISERTVANYRSALPTCRVDESFAGRVDSVLAFADSYCEDADRQPITEVLR